MPVPVGFAVQALLAGGTGAVAGGTGTVAGGGAHATAGLVDRLVQAAQGLWAKPVALATAGAVTVAGGAAVLYPVTQDPEAALPPPLRPAISSPPTSRATATAPATQRTPRLSATPSPTVVVPRFAYGQTVDMADKTPPRYQRPAVLPTRREGAALTTTGAYDSRSPNGGFKLVHRGEQLTIAGRGYFQIRWQVIYRERAGHLQMPSWTGLKGRLFHVASGGGYRLDDSIPGTTDQSWMGDRSYGRTVLPDGAQQMWQNEFYYVDGAVTLHQNETGADYNLIVFPVRREQIVTDLNQPPSATALPVRYGLVRDTGRDDAPVPQYLTRAERADPRSVAQRTRVS